VSHGWPAAAGKSFIAPPPEWCGDVEVRAVFTGRGAGDLGGNAPDVDAMRRRVADSPWSWVRQMHGAGVVRVDQPGGCSGLPGDALVTRHRGVALAVFTADCAPLVLVGSAGVVGVVHAGWRGLLAGVVEEAASAMRALGSGVLSGALGPCIHRECYEFGPSDLEAAARTLGPSVVSSDSGGNPAFDLPAAVRTCMQRADVELTADARTCTACSGGYWSHRARRDTARQATVAWLL
jgi:hypothetical protein